MRNEMDSTILDNFFGSEEIRKLFDDHALMQSWLDVEAALARAQASLDIIPSEAASAITAAAHIEQYNLSALAAAAKETAHPLVPLIQELAVKAGKPADRYVHLGSTTQDVMDTGFVLLARQGLDVIDRQMGELTEILHRLAIRYKTTPMAARTHGQHALPTTFGLRAAGWYDEMQRHQNRSQEMRTRLLVGSFGAAAGTLAGYGPKALKLRHAMMGELDLGEPETSWHANQDRFSECLSLFGMIASSGEKLAREVYFLGRPEIGEAFESQGVDQVCSSTMPQKQNPIRSEAVMAAAQTLRAQVPLAQAAMVAQDDRDMGAGMTLWKLLPEAFILLGGILERLIDVIGDWRIDSDAMARNLKLSGGLILSEAVMLQLSDQIGRTEAHHAVTEAVRRTMETGQSIKECLAEHEAISERLTETELAALLDPENYLGAAAEIVDRVTLNKDRNKIEERE